METRAAGRLALECDHGSFEPDNGDPNAGIPGTGLVIGRKDAKNVLTSYVYDDFDRVKEKVDRLGKSTSTTFDVVGRVKTLKDAENKVTAYDYDLLGQKTKTTYEDGSEFQLTNKTKVSGTNNSIYTRFFGLPLGLIVDSSPRRLAVSIVQSFSPYGQNKGVRYQ